MTFIGWRLTCKACASDTPMSEITPELLLRAYASGIFPMAESRDSDQLFWVDPKVRGILPLDKFHVPRRLARTVRQDPFRITTDSAFAEVIAACADRARGREDSWINDEIVRLYVRLFELGHAHSIECWDGNRLVGGLYGISLGAAYFGESMFHTETDASKVALVHLVARLRHGGYLLLDTQFVTDHLRHFGAIEISKAEYQTHLARAMAGVANYHSLPDDASGSDVLQLITQTS